MKVFIIVLIIIVAIIVITYFIGKRMLKKQEESEQKLEANKQPVTMLVLDKKKMKFKDAGLPKAVVDATPWYARRGKVPVVRVKVGPQILNLVADEAIFDEIPVKKMVRAQVSGIYIMEVRGTHGQRLEKPEKKGFMARFTSKVREIGHAQATKVDQDKK